MDHDSKGERIEVASRDELRAWLGRHGERRGGVWLGSFKKGNPRHLPYEAMVEELLAHGWVDSRPRALDGQRSMHRIAPRDPASTRSRANRERVARLEAEGRMTEAGRAVPAAKGSGAWRSGGRARARR